VIFLILSLIKNRGCSKGQVSIEYLLLFAAFFAVLGISLPVISYSVDAFFVSSDVILAKKVSSDLNESISLFSFLSNGSSKSLSYVSSKGIGFSQKGGVLAVSVGEKSFGVELNGAKIVGSGNYLGTFEIRISKNSNITELTISNKS